MKTQKRLIVSLVMMVMTLGVSAQTSRAEWRVYHKGMINSWYGFPKETVDSIVYTDKNYDVFVTSAKDISDEGRWLMKVNGSGEISIATTKIGVVAADIANEKVEEMFLAGQLTDLHEAKVDSTNRQNTFDFVVEDGSWKPVVFGFDADGEYRSLYIGKPQSFTSDFKEDINGQLMLFNASSNPYSRWGYGSIMHIRDLMGEDMAVPKTYYDHYNAWQINKYLGGEYIHADFVSRYFQSSINGLNVLIPIMEKRMQQVDVSASLGYATALRAMLYLDAARMYEFMENDKISPINSAGNDVTGLTFPIVEEPWKYPYPGKNVKRATRDEMASYLTSQLARAEELLEGTNISDKIQASLAVVYGLKARLCMWLGDYAQAQMNAEWAIAKGDYTPLTRDQWLDITNGFNNRTLSSWMWGMNFPAEPGKYFDNINVLAPEPYSIEYWQTLANWTSWCSNEFSKGFAGEYGVYSTIGRSIYDRIADTDFRKLSFKAPSGSSLAGKEPHLNDQIFNQLPNYASLKFRPGQGNTIDNKVACVVDIPLMRIEEMHFIRIEAMAQRGELETAKNTLVNFMQQYRDANYTCSATTKEELIDEIFLQKRIELWGEGQNYFDYKRLNKSVTRKYEGTNFASDRYLNTTTRPAWMNFVLVNGLYRYSWTDSEGNYQSADPLADWNNPDPSDCYTLE